MEAKRELQSIKEMRGKIAYLERVRVVALSRATSTTSRLKEHISGNKGGGYIPVVDMVDADDEIKLLKKQLCAEKERITQRIRGLDQVNYAELLELHHVHGLPLYEVAKVMGYSYDWVRSRHARALKAYQEKYFGESVHNDTQ